jgi:phosphomannomutase
MAQILDAMALRQRPVSQLADELPQYAICKTKVPLQRDRIAAAVDALEREFAEVASDRLDGLRLDWPDRWLLVRASNTEPIIRAVAEAPQHEAAQDLCAQATRIIQSVK